MKLTKNFSFPYLLTHKVVRNLRVENEQIGFLEVEGTATKYAGISTLEPLEDRFDIDIDFIKWNGTDIKAVLEITQLIDDIYGAALEHAASLTFQNYQQSKTA